jgi:hypothetical protein
MIEDRSGAVWIGTRAGGLFRFANSRFECVTTSHRQILCLAEDREGNLWAGTAGGGLNRIRPRTIQLEDTTSGLPFETLRSVCETAGYVRGGGPRRRDMDRHAESRDPLLARRPFHQFAANERLDRPRDPGVAVQPGRRPVDWTECR